MADNKAANTPRQTYHPLAEDAKKRMQRQAIIAIAGYAALKIGILYGISRWAKKAAKNS